MARPRVYNEEQAMRVMLASKIPPGFIDSTLKFLFHKSNPDRCFKEITHERLITWCQLVQLGQNPWEEGGAFEFVGDPAFTDNQVMLMLRYRQTSTFKVLMNGEFSTEQLDALAEITREAQKTGANQEISWLFDYEMPAALIKRLYRIHSEFTDSALPAIVRDANLGSDEVYAESLERIADYYEAMPRSLRSRRLSDIFKAPTIIYKDLVIKLLELYSKGYDVTLIEENLHDPPLMFELYYWIVADYPDICEALYACQNYGKGLDENNIVNIFAPANIMCEYRRFKEECKAASKAFPPMLYHYAQPATIRRLLALYLKGLITDFDLRQRMTTADIERREHSVTTASGGQFNYAPEDSSKVWVFDLDPKVKELLEPHHCNRLYAYIKRIGVLRNYPYFREDDHTIQIACKPVCDYEPINIKIPNLEAIVDFPREDFGGRDIVATVSASDCSAPNPKPIVIVYI